MCWGGGGGELKLERCNQILLACENEYAVSRAGNRESHVYTQLNKEGGGGGIGKDVNENHWHLKMVE